MVVQNITGGLTAVDGRKSNGCGEASPPAPKCESPQKQPGGGSRK